METYSMLQTYSGLTMQMMPIRCLPLALKFRAQVCKLLLLGWNLSERNQILGTPADTDGFKLVLGRGHHVKNTSAMSSAITRLGEDENGEPAKSTRPRKSATKRTENQYSALNIEESSDAEDGNFDDEMPDLQSASDSKLDSDKDTQMTNEEVLLHVYRGSIISHVLLFPACQHLTT